MRVASPIESGVDAIEILEVAADIGEAMLHRLRGGDARQRRQPCQEGAGRRIGAAGHGDIGAIGQLGVDPGLGPVCGVEDRRRGGEGHRQQHHREGARHPVALAMQGGRYQAGERPATGRSAAARRLRPGPSATASRRAEIKASAIQSRVGEMKA